MALSQADFYAYSRATGAPVPEDPEERAQMAPSVAEFRRNQLKAPEQGQQQGQNALATLAGIGAMALAGVGAYQFAKGRLPKGAPASATAPVQTVDIMRQAETNLRRVTTEGTQPAPSTPPPLSRQEVYKQVAAKPVEDLPRVYRPKGGADVPTYTDPRTGEIFSSGRNPSATTKTAGFTPRQYVESTGSLEVDPTDRLVEEMSEFQAARKKQLESRMGRAYGQQLEKTADDLLQQLQVTAPDLTTIQESSVGAQQNQFINAVESGEDQSTGRLIKQLTVGDPWGESTVPPAAVNEQKATLLLPAAVTSPREKAQSFLQQRFEKLGAVVPGRYRRERIMGEDPQIAEAMELYASTGDPSVLSRLSEAPSSPLTVIPRVQTELKDKEEIPTGMFYQATGQGEFVDDLFEKDIKLTNRISSLGEAKQNVLNRLKEIDELEPQLRFAAADEPGQGGYYTRMLNKVMFEKQSLDPDSFNADLGDAIAQRDFVRAQMESAESLGSQYKLINRQEGVRPFFEVDPVTNQPIPETLEIRTGRRSVQSEEEKTSGGRGYAMYDPDSQTGSSIGVYGIEPRNYPIADPELRPTVLQREETRVPLRRMPTEGPALKTYIEETKRARAATPQTKQRSIEVSEALRRANIEGRDPNKVLRQLGFNL